MTFDKVFSVHSSSSSSTDSSSSSGSNSPLSRFNRILRSSVAHRWSFFRRTKLDVSGRSLSDVGLSTIVDNDLSYETVRNKHRSFYGFSSLRQRRNVPKLFLTSAGGSTSLVIGVEEASDVSDSERQSRNTHLRVPTPAFVGQSTGNFAAGNTRSGVGARSAPTTPLQLEPTPKPPLPPPHKNEKQAVKPLSSSAPSFRASVISSTGSVTVAGGDAGSDASDGKAPSKARQKKFFRHFPQVGPEERVLNYYSCALVGDILLQGHLYITKNYFAFYSNVFGYVTKLLIPTVSVIRISKEKMARIIPNAVGVCTRDERHVFGSLLSRDSTHKLMTRVWKAARVERAPVPPASDLRISEVELDASEYPSEDETSSNGGDNGSVRHTKRRDPDIIVSGPGAAVIQPALLTGATAIVPPRAKGGVARALLIGAALLLAISAMFMSVKLYEEIYKPQDELLKLSGNDLYLELMRWRARLHGRAASEMHTFITTNLLLLSKVRQSLEVLSSVILTDMANYTGSIKIDVPPDTNYS